MDTSDGGGGGTSGYTATTTDLAARVGELRAVASTVSELAGTLDLNAGNAGPGELPGALSEFAEELRATLSEMNDKIDTVADNVDDAVVAYDAVEEYSADEMIRLADLRTSTGIIDQLEGQAGTLLAQQEAALAPDERDTGSPNTRGGADHGQG